jgi:hypothetical protein
MDEELTLHELRRLEAERKLRTIPAQVLETAWVRDAQVEAVADAVLAITYTGDAAAYARARHVGEWCARIAAALPNGPEPALARRVGVLSDVDPAALERIAELEYLALYVREYQSTAILGTDCVRTMSLVLAVAVDFSERISPDSRDVSASPTRVLLEMYTQCDSRWLPILDALSHALHDPNVILIPSASRG